MQEHNHMQFADSELADYPFYNWTEGTCKRASAFPEISPAAPGDTASFAAVLKQPETKRKQRVFVEDLAVPADKLSLDFSDCDRLEGAVLAYERPLQGEARSLQVKARAGTKARLYLLEETASGAGLSAAGKPAVFIRALVEQDAELEIICLHPSDFAGPTAAQPETEVTLLYEVRVGRGGHFKWTSLNFTKPIREKGLVILEEADATADVGHAAYVAAGLPHHSQVNIHCRAPRGRALIRQHGVVADDGDGSFFSIADIDKGACGAVIREDNRILTLGSRAKTFTDPVLLIREHDVAASHAATVGELDPEILFYLCSRGLSEVRAKELITVGYLMPLIDRLPDAGVRATLRRLLTERIGSGREGLQQHQPEVCEQ